MKKSPNHIAWILLPLAGAFLASTPSQAVETIGAPGSPSATTTILGSQLPAPDQPFGGDIQQDALKPKAWWAPRVVPPTRAALITGRNHHSVGFGVISEQSTGFPGNTWVLKGFQMGFKP